jgi:hypothetical protein
MHREIKNTDSLINFLVESEMANINQNFLFFPKLETDKLLDFKKLIQENQTEIFKELMKEFKEKNQISEES